MNIIWEKIVFKNFMSYGDTETTFFFNKSPSTLITGLNGAGKSSVVEAFVFAIKGNTYRGSNKKDLINTINKKDCLVKLYFSKGGSRYEIHRGMKPDIFYILKDAVKIEESASIRDMQQYLESHVLQTPVLGIIKTSILGCDYKPFMMMSSKEKRELIEYILEINVFTDMNKHLKNVMSTFKDNLIELQSKIQIKESIISAKKEILDNIKSKTQKDNNKDKEELKELKLKLKCINENITEYNNKLLSLSYNKNIDEIKNIVSTLTENLNKIKYDVESKKNAINKMKQIDGTCTECGSEITQTHKDNHISIYEKEIKELAKIGKEVFNERSNLIKDIEEYEKFLENKNNITNIIKTLINQHESFNELFEKKTLEYKEKVKTESVDINHHIDEYNNLVNELNDLKNIEKEFLYQKQIHNISSQLLKDDGIKAYIVDQYIPILNQSVNYYLKCLNSPLIFNIDKNLDVRLDLRYPGEFNYYTLSMGERQRIDLSMSFAWRKLASIKNSINTNLLILDETFDASIDMDGVEDLLLILNDLNKNGVNVFVISHKGGLEDKLRSTVRVKKVNQFSRFEIENKD